MGCVVPVVSLVSRRIPLLMQRFDQEPLARQFGMQLEELSAGTAWVVYQCRPEDCVTNDTGCQILQGGIIGGVLADFAAVYAAMSVIPSGHTPLVTANFSIHRPVLAGERITAKASVFNRSKTLIYVDVRIYWGNKLKCSGQYQFMQPVEPV